MQHLSTHKFVNDFTEAFDGDQSGDPQPRQTPGVLYSRVLPSPVRQPKLLAWTTDLATELGIREPDENDLNILGGNAVNPSMKPYAACYAGHQFGNWAGQLGDGRAITLGEWPLPDGKSWELQLKGAGLTPYSRRADGRAVLRSSVREYLMSEAMFHLGVPTTRALSLVATGDQVRRDMFYDGRPAPEPGAIVMRAAPSFLRFGNFEMLSARKEYENLQKLVDWTIEKFYPELTGADKTLQWFKKVMESTATMVVDWLRVGFVHGVMNTDNMSILGLTIDYGPFSFLDAYDLNFSPNTTDHPGLRYAYGKQHSIAYWNLSCLANAISPLFEDPKELISTVESFGPVFFEKFYSMKADKMGLDELVTGDVNLIDDFENLLASVQPDMTIFYQLLGDLPEDLTDTAGVNAYFTPSFYHPLSEIQLALFHKNIIAYQERLAKNTISRAVSRSKMKACNPRFILRNYLLYEAIQELEKGEDQLFKKLQKALETPYSKDHDEFFALRPQWANEQPGSATLSCSS
ncbi:YdiU family protein [Pedobacter sp. PLR]|uniref:protein adenylyltransferase SelO n=1 Tax=Pedobacter sp. PLR TaxID=2994465 RepID=UPI002245E260|nr:YdiU family protein [Pedobacter sp. PLR]MCX2451001.1 YdiU family protein [Pedobacter sp. PLR]